MMKEFSEMMKADKELQELINQYRLIFGKHRPFSIWTDGGIEGYKEKLRKSIEERKPY